MKRIRIIGLALVAVFAMSAVGVSSASAASTNNPQWEICKNVGKHAGGFENHKCAKAGGLEEWAKVILGTGATAKVTAVANGNQLLVVKSLLGNFTITCKTIKLEAATIIGSVKPVAGTSKEVIVYGECKIEGKPKCEVFSPGQPNGTIKTVPLKNTLVFTTEKAAINELSEEGGLPTGSVLFEPETGTSFVSITLKGAECPFETTTTVEGKVGARELGTPEVFAIVHEIEGIETGSYWKNVAGVSTKFTVARLKAFGVEAGYTGKARLEVENGGVLNEGWGWRIFN